MNFSLDDCHTSGFWQALDDLLKKARIIIDRPKGSRHPRYKDFIYPLDYGYLENTKAPDGSEIDLWRGTEQGRGLDAILLTVDLDKADLEIKLLVDCSETEKKEIFHQQNIKGMYALYIPRKK